MARPVMRAIRCSTGTSAPNRGGPQTRTPAYVSGTMLELLCVKKSLILQVAPGTGQNPARAALAYALIGQKSRDQISVPFQPNFACDDFARNRRLTGNGDGYS